MISTETSARPVKCLKPDSTGIYWDMGISPSGTDLLKLSGDLKPGWLGRLSSHLSHKKINILTGSARKSAPLCWDASFEIEPAHKHLNPFREFDPLPAIIGPVVQVDLPPLKISDFQIEHSTRHGGSLYTEISGKDCIGFLYGMLRVFSFYSLFPTELEISTKGMIASDRFWLKGIGASVPEKDDMTALHERLTIMLAGKS